ncbi:family 43 glycosylhydrolase [Klebsiella sp. 2680]|uniref:family 43 glycosylhydrolase n=1 Tax=Klebsiella sp. 2680 TaxID=2018037 RepID=UPI00115A896F|nr:family 43 glycosylhydrolase [Klebsiella sp. 2680]
MHKGTVLCLLLSIIPLAHADSSGLPATVPGQATLFNFAPRDVLQGQDGLPPSPHAPLKYGAPVLHLDVAGNAVEEHAASVAYFNDQYWMYAEKWGCGKLVMFSGSIPGKGGAEKLSPVKNAGQCGLAAYSSPDMTNWTFQGLYQPEGIRGSAAKPHVLWSQPLKKYVMWFKAGDNFARTGGLYYALADSPAGPWSQPKIATGPHLAHDFDITISPEGKAYIVTDVFSGQFDKTSPGGHKPLWDLWIQALTPELTGTVAGSATRILKAADFEAVGLFTHNGYWYITGGPTCGNCQVPIRYLYSSSVTSGWTNEQGETGDELKMGSLLTQDGCTGQNKGADTLPSLSGPVILSAIWGYRTGPASYAPKGRVVHGDNSQAISSTYWFPVTFNAKHQIEKFTCPAQVNIPLNRAVSPPAPAPWQPVCQIRHGSVVKQTLPSLNRYHGALTLSLFQRTDDEGPLKQNGVILNAPLNVDIRFTDGSEVRRRIPATGVAFTPQVQPFTLSDSKTVSDITLSSEATNGCYGTVVAPARSSMNRYSVLKKDDDQHHDGVRMYTGPDDRVP